MTVLRGLKATDAIVLAAALAVIVGSGVLSGLREERTQSGFDTFSTYDVQSGGYRAWYELLQHEGVRVARFERRPAFIDDSIDVYVMASNTIATLVRAQGQGEPADLVEAGDWAAVAKWVHAGGHLVWLSGPSNTVANHAFSSEPQGLNAPPLAASGLKTDGAVTVAPSPITAGVYAVSGIGQLRFPFDRSSGSAPLVADDTGAVVAAYRFGKGDVTIVSDDSLFENSRLSMADNARLAYDLVAASLPPHGLVAFDEWSHGYAAGDTWWTILPAQFRVALVIIGAAMLLLVVGTALRFGPTAELPADDERTSAEYLTSMAALYARGNAVKAAIDDLTGACLREAAAAVGLGENATARAIALRLGGPAEGPADDVMEIDRLRSFEYPKAPDLLRAASLCAELRKELLPHGKPGLGRRTAPAGRSA